MLLDSQVDAIIDTYYQKFILTEYDEFSKDYEEYPSDEINFQLTFDEYVRELPDAEIADWIYCTIDNYDDINEDDDVLKIRNQISFTTDVLLERNHKILMWTLSNATRS